MIIDSLRKHANLNPDSLAVVFKNKKLSYGELEKKSNQLASFLKKKKMSVDFSVGLHMKRSIELVISLVAIMKAEGYYVPLDYLLPKKRLDYIVSSADMDLILTEVDVDLDNWVYSSEDGELDYRYDQNSLIYVMFTSGSSGNPKGVKVTHKGVSNYLQWMRKSLQVKSEDKILQTTSFGFDISVWELFLPLISGAQLVLAEHDVLKSMECITNNIVRHKITIVQFVPSVLSHFVNFAMVPEKSSLRCIVSGGEELSKSLMKKTLKRFKLTLYNLYGPTETSIYSCFHICKSSDDSPIVPIGKPISNTSIYIFNSDMRLVDQGEKGEIFIGGHGVSKGYLKNEELTKQKFVENPFSSGEKLYRTGDLGRLKDDGNFEFLGRIDSQIKLRGFRVELRDIENNLLQCEKLKDARLLYHDKKIIAFLVLASGSSISRTYIVDFLSVRLPSYMIPAEFFCVKNIPITLNGKLDKSTLINIYNNSKEADTMEKQKTNVNNNQLALSLDSKKAIDNALKVSKRRRQYEYGVEGN